MALIYAFQDATGKWYGESDEVSEWPEPGVAELTMDASQEDADPEGPFFGQCLTVKYASMEGPPGGDRYLLSTGRSYFTTAAVEKLLGNWPYVRRRFTAEEE